METPQEKEFYSDGNVLVTQARFVVDGKTFAMRNISSVTKYKIPPSNGIAYFIGIIGFFLLFVNSLFWVGGLIIALATFLFVSIKASYSVRINSNSGEANAVVSPDEGYIQKIVDAVNEAIVYRG